MELFDYRNETFSPLPCEDDICKVCYRVLYNPVKCPCQHVFCKDCISQWIQENRTCPKCRRPTGVSSLVYTKISILKFQIKCRNSSQGCQIICPVRLYETHRKKCLSQIIKCSQGTCGTEILLRDKTKHELTECAFYYSTCRVCKKLVTHHKLDNHDCLSMLSDELYSVGQRVNELEDEKRSLHCRIQEANKNNIEMVEKVTQTLHEIRHLRDIKHGKHAVICTLQKEMEALRNLVEVVSNPTKQNAGFPDELENVLRADNRDMLWFCIVLLICSFVSAMCINFCFPSLI